jgi:hypothetical protein
MSNLLYEEQQEDEQYAREQKQGLKDANIDVGVVSGQIYTQKDWNKYFSLSKFMTNADSSSLTPTSYVMNINDMQLFDNGNLHSLDVFKIKASAMLSDLKLDEVTKMNDGSITQSPGLSYNIFINSNGPSFSGVSTNLNTLNSAIGSDGIRFLNENQVPFVIVWSGYMNSTNSDKTINNIINYDFAGNNSNQTNTLSLKINDSSNMDFININNQKITKGLFQNVNYPIHVIYISNPYSNSDNISFQISNSSNNKYNLSYFKEKGQIYEPKSFYFGMVQSNTLYKFYTIYDSETNITLKLYKYLNVNTNFNNIKIQINDNAKPTSISIPYLNNAIQATQQNTLSAQGGVLVYLNKLETTFRANKQFYVNEYDKEMTFVPYNASFLIQSVSSPYVKAGSFAPPNNLTLNANNIKDTDYTGCKQFCKDANCTSFYSYIESVPYTVIEQKSEKYTVDVSSVVQVPTKTTVTKQYPSSTMPFDKNTNSYNYSGTTFSKNEDVWVNEPKTIWSKETRTRMVDNPVTKYKNVKKCILNNDYNEINMVPLDKMNTIQPETKIKSSNLYIQNKNFSMDSQYMPEYVKTKNDYNYYNINDISNYTQGYAYLGKMNAPTLIGKPSLEPVIQTTQLHEDTIDNLINNNLILSTNAESFATREGYDGNYDGVTATSNSILNRLSTINNINVDISNNIYDIERIYADLSGNCLGTSEQIQRCIKYKFSTHDNAKITKKIADKNDAYQEDLTEVQLQQNNTYVLGAITTASLLIFAIMLGRG